MSSQNKEESFKTHINASIKIFTVITFIFFIIKGFVLYSSIDLTNKNINSLRTVSTFAFIVLFFIFSYITNISATQQQIICGKINYKIAFYATVTPFIFIYSIGIFLISIFPGWTRCFSNTFGSAFLDICGLKSKIVESLHQNANLEGKSFEIYKLYKESPQILLNEIEIDENENIPDGFKSKLQEIGILAESNSENELLLKQYIFSKETIGEGVWHYLLGLITMLVSYNAILAENCNAFTVKNDDFRRYLNDKFQKN